jgi:glycosyltransferase involved in cell wall biosynthesis
LATAARDEGFDVHVITRVNEDPAPLSDLGFTVHPVDINRAGLDPIADLRFIRSLVGLYKDIQPDLVHHVALKPVLYGSLAAARAKVPFVVNALAGLGYVFSSGELTARLLRMPVRRALRLAINRSNTTTIVQNIDDQRILSAIGGDSTRLILIRGSGIDTRRFTPGGDRLGTPVVALAARLTADKGVYDFIEAARRLQQRGTQARFVLVGRPDESNPASITKRELDEWVGSGLIEWWGYSRDMPATLGRVDIACLPSTYGEGLPKSLLEAAACAIPIVTTDSPGCRDTVVHEHSGLLVPPRRPEALAAALLRLIEDPETRRRMGKAGREYVQAHFAESKIVGQTLNLYSNLLGASS